MKNNDSPTWSRFFVRQFYDFATWCAGKQSKTTISQNFRSTVLRFCNIKTIFVRQFYVFATWCAGKQSKTTISRNFRSTVLRFCNIKTIFVRQFYVFATLMSGKQSKTTIRSPKCATVLRFCYFFRNPKRSRKRAKKKTPQILRPTSEKRFRGVS